MLWSQCWRDVKATRRSSILVFMTRFQITMTTTSCHNRINVKFAVWNIVTCVVRIGTGVQQFCIILRHPSVARRLDDAGQTGLFRICSWRVLRASLHGYRAHAFGQLVADGLAMAIVQIAKLRADVVVVVGHVPSIICQRRTAHGPLAPFVDGSRQGIQNAECQHPSLQLMTSPSRMPLHLTSGRVSLTRCRLDSVVSVDPTFGAKPRFGCA
mmetsp:Transcript_17058/g.47925  ORF Transcript_17058/g.47925 Transcript_17058/m.47925 type:complete len:212 (-) Transcript_17058:1503-2138(-)